MTGACAWCRRSFTGRSQQRFCSRSCANHWRWRDTPRTPRPWSTTSRAPVDKAHRQLRAVMVPAALGTRCPIGGPRCDGLMTNPQRMQLDHRHARALGGQSTRENCRVVCTNCNHWLGSKLGGQTTSQRHGQQRRNLPRW